MDAILPAHASRWSGMSYPSTRRESRLPDRSTTKPSSYRPIRVPLHTSARDTVLRFRHAKSKQPHLGLGRKPPTWVSGRREVQPIQISRPPSAPSCRGASEDASCRSGVPRGTCGPRAQGFQTIRTIASLVEALVAPPWVMKYKAPSGPARRATGPAVSPCRNASLSPGRPLFGSTAA